MCAENVIQITNIVKECKTTFPDKEIWLWSGYNFIDYISKLNIVKYLDYVVDGEYIDELRDIRLKYRGSSNQNIWKNQNGKWKLDNE